MRGVVAQRWTPGRPSTGVAMPLPSTVQPSGAVTVTSKTALRSGWSKAAKTSGHSVRQHMLYR